MMSNRAVLIIGLLTIFIACHSGSNSGTSVAQNKAQAVVDSAIAAMNGRLLDHAEISFGFRVRDYIFRNQNGIFQYTRIFVDTAGTKTIDVLTNDGLTRTINGNEVTLDSTWTTRYSNSVNSVMYFSFLPYRLNDDAVIKTYNGVVTLKGKRYHEILIQFQEEGGGVDHDDNFLYWFDTSTYALDYFGYDYITDGGGVRFREAINRRDEGGLIVQDYINYMPASDSVVLKDVLAAYLRGELKELSRIELDDVVVESLLPEE